MATDDQRSQKGYTLSFIEFDDFGEFFSRCQLENALHAIAEANNKGKRPAVVVIFVHGWKNNASDKTGNVWGFRDSLQDLAKVAPAGWPVVGVYIGWRGAVVEFPVAKELTFYDRRNTATHVSGAQVTETLVRLLEAAKGPNFKGDSVCVLIGHSFGALLLEHAITQTIVNMLIRDEEGACKDEQGKNAYCSPADLITFVNEAGPALEAKPMLEFLSSQDVHLTDGQRPLFVSMTSKGDAATKFFLPAAQFVSRPLNSLRTYPDPAQNYGFKNQGSLYIQSTANSQALVTHFIGRASDPDIQAACRSDLEFTHFLIGNDGYRVVRRVNAPNQTAYWVMQMPVEIVPDHSTIFRPQFRELLKAMLVPTRVKEPGECGQPVPKELRRMDLVQKPAIKKRR